MDEVAQQTKVQKILVTLCSKVSS